jgi:hypothetical protein
MKLKPKTPPIVSRFAGLDPQNEIFPMLIGSELLFNIPAHQAAQAAKIPESVIKHLIKQGKLTGDIDNWRIAPSVLKGIALHCSQRGLNQTTPTLTLVKAFRTHLAGVLCERTPALEARTHVYFRNLARTTAPDHILGLIDAFFASEKQQTAPNYSLDRFSKFVGKSIVKVGKGGNSKVMKQKFTKSQEIAESL